jgi:inorganic pyrophosphatase
MWTIRNNVAEGATTFLFEEYKILIVFCLLFSVLIALLVEEPRGSFWTVSAYVLGVATSILSGWIGMKVAVTANIKTAYSCIDREKGLERGFVAAFRAGCTLGFCLVSLGLLNLFALIMVHNYMRDPDSLDS